MSARRQEGIAKKACTRCSIQKRRCDKTLPECGLCMRLYQVCRYEAPALSSSGSAPSTSPRPEFLGRETFTPRHVKDAITERLGSLMPEDSFAKYTQSIEPWFPIISQTLRSRLPTSWNDASLDFSLLCLSIILLATSAPPSSENGGDLFEFKSLYLCTKSSISLIDGMGINSVEVVQARILVNLFEVAHGFYPAAYISIGATVRAADALGAHLGVDASIFYSWNDEIKRQETVLIWCGILILDRYIAIESGPHPSLTRAHTHIIDELIKPTLCHTNFEQDRTNPVSRFSRLVEASVLLDRIHTMLHNPTAEQTFNIEEVMLLVGTLNNLKTIVTGEIGNVNEVYSSGLGLCNIALLLAYESGSKVPPLDGVTSSCNSIATASLIALIVTITSTVEPFVLGKQTIDFNLLPSFYTFLVYKVTAIVTERLWTESDLSEGLKRLRILRAFLKMMGARWLSCERYLKILNEDTTPRILKAIEQ